jgi:hypothetical protein
MPSKPGRGRQKVGKLANKLEVTMCRSRWTKDEQDERLDEASVYTKCLLIALWASAVGYAGWGVAVVLFGA